MTREQLLLVAQQVLGGKKLHEIDFGEPKLDLEEKLKRIDLAIRQYPVPEEAAMAGQGTECRSGQESS
jgi:hypothetical protein